jgi:hypothetical protein
MKPTYKSMAAYLLGVHFQHLNHEGFKPQYDAWRKLIQENLDLLGIQLKMPATVNEYDLEKIKILSYVAQHLKRLREQYGGEVLAVTMFDFGYMPLDLVAASYYRYSTFDEQVTYFASVLLDFRIEAPTESLKRFLARETAWLMEQAASRSGSLDMNDAIAVALRLTNRVTQLARAADKLLVGVHFDNMPFRSVFLSFSTEDEKFAEKLYRALSEAGIRVWFAPHDMAPGKKLHHQIHQAIDRYDKLLLVLSEASMKSDWVSAELFRAREREQNEGVQMLFPVRIAHFDMIRKWTLFDADGGRDLAREVREYFIADFSQWTDDAILLNQAHQLIEALMVEDVQPDSIMYAAKSAATPSEEEKMTVMDVPLVADAAAMPMPLIDPKKRKAQVKRAPTKTPPKKATAEKAAKKTAKKSAKKSAAKKSKRAAKHSPATAGRKVAGKKKVAKKKKAKKSRR